MTSFKMADDISGDYTKIVTAIATVVSYIDLAPLKGQAIIITNNVVFTASCMRHSVPRSYIYNKRDAVSF